MTDDDGTLKADGGAAVKLVMAYVRPDRLSAVKDALAEVGAPALTVTEVAGRGTEPATTNQWRGEEYTVDLHEKVKIECVVNDVPASEAADAIREAAHTGEKGDGKVFVVPVEAAYDVRTGATGSDAV